MPGPAAAGIPAATGDSEHGGGGGGGGGGGALCLFVVFLFSASRSAPACPSCGLIELERRHPVYAELQRHASYEGSAAAEKRDTLFFAMVHSGS